MNLLPPKEVKKGTRENYFTCKRNNDHKKQKIRSDTTKPIAE